MQLFVSIKRVNDREGVRSFTIQEAETYYYSLLLTNNTIHKNACQPINSYYLYQYLYS